MATDDRALLERIERLLMQLVERQTVKEWYTVEEFAGLVRRQPFTVRQWCNLGRINAEKSNTGCGGGHAWVVSRRELERFQHDGLLPPRRPDRVA